MIIEEATTVKALRAEASRLEIPGRSKMGRDDLITAIRAATERIREEGQRQEAKREAVEALRETLSDPRMVETVAADVPSVRTGDVSCVDCHAVFNVSDTAQCVTCHPKVTPATVFGGLPRTKFKVTRTSARRRNVRNRRK